ncbi:MAG: DsbA family oxidoreductase [Spirochaetales bacterium]|nr:DsbA family oxidoreductase [Spirochaetales bacterium]
MIQPAPEAEAKTLRLVVYSDYVCPWCYVGQAVIEELRAERPVEVRWKPFFLRPDTPPEGMPLPKEIQARIALHNPLPARAAAAGLPFIQNFYLPNTQRAHEATEFAFDKGRGEEFHRAVFHQYFGLGNDIGQWVVLKAVAAEVGMNPDEMEHEVEAGTFRSRFEASLREAQEIGVTGVPTYVLDDKIGIVGAQGIEAFHKALAQIS